MTPEVAARLAMLVLLSGLGLVAGFLVVGWLRAVRGKSWSVNLVELLKGLAGLLLLAVAAVATVIAFALIIPLLAIQWGSAIARRLGEAVLETLPGYPPRSGRESGKPRPGGGSRTSESKQSTKTRWPRPSTFVSREDDDQGVQ